MVNDGAEPTRIRIESGVADALGEELTLAPGQQRTRLLQDVFAEPPAWIALFEHPPNPVFVSFVLFVRKISDYHEEHEGT